MERKEVDEEEVGSNVEVLEVAEGKEGYMELLDVTSGFEEKNSC